MVKKFLMFVALILGGIGFGQAAQETPTSPDASASKQRDAALIMEGEITRVDDKQNMFWLQMPDGREMQFSFAADTATAAPSSPSATQGLRDNKLEKGMHVKVEYDNVGGSNVVTKIEIQPAKG
jgi:hypothetical protein